MDLAVLKTKVVKLTVEFDDEAIHMEILPHKLTPEYRSRLQARSEAAGDQDADATIIADLVVAWDVCSDGAPFPPTYENLRALPLSMLTVIAGAIIQEVARLATPRREN